MYTINNSTIITVYDRYTDAYIFQGNYKEFIIWLSLEWKQDLEEEYSNEILALYYCSKGDLISNPYRHFLIFDNDERVLNPQDFKEESFWIATHSSLRKRSLWWLKRTNHSFWWLKNNKNYIFRKDPVPCVRKWRGGPHQKMPKTKQIFLDYSIPENRPFQRGSKKNVPSWWDDKIKSRNIKNWKHQNKCRHQWQRGEKDRWLGQLKETQFIQMDMIV